MIGHVLRSLLTPALEVKGYILEAVASGEIQTEEEKQVDFVDLLYDSLNYNHYDPMHFIEGCLEIP